MPDPEPSHNIVVISDKTCWKKPTLQWQNLIIPAVLQTLLQTKWPQSAEINILLTDDSRLKQLNNRFRGQNKATNVISFPSLEPEERAQYLEGKSTQQPIVLGDIALAYETIEKESISQKKPFNDHLLHLVVHGVLHLLGFDHEKDEDAAIMESLEIKILSYMNIRNPYEE